MNKSEKDIFDTMLAAMKRAGTAPELVYAFKKTKRIVTEENASQLTDAEIEEWNAAIDEYFKLHPKSLS